MSVPDSLTQMLTSPTPEGLWALRGDLLVAGVPAGLPVWHVLDQAHHFLNTLKSKSTAREYSHFASLLDIGAIGLVVLDNLGEGGENEGFLGKILTGALSEGLMVLAARQYVKAWEEEMSAVYQEAAWALYQLLWHVSEQMQSGLKAGERRTLIDHLLRPLTLEDTPGTVKAILAGRLYQLLLLVHVHRQLSPNGRA